MVLRVSEHFYSIQGEGSTQGIPSIFLRLQGCNLSCGKKELDGQYKKPDAGCKWVCDTIDVWMKGKMYKTDELLDLFVENNYIEMLKEDVHLIITGGEPLMQQKGIIEFLQAIKAKFAFIPFVEVETNGTIKPIADLYSMVDIFNVSPKLSNSGMIKSRRLNDEAIEFHVTSPVSIFKFVLVDDEDKKEVLESYIEPFKIPRDKVWLMPGAYDRKELQKNIEVVAEFAKEHRFNLSSRMHVEIWNKLTGV